MEFFLLSCKNYVTLRPLINYKAAMGKWGGGKYCLLYFHRSGFNRDKWNLLLNLIYSISHLIHLHILMKEFVISRKKYECMSAWCWISCNFCFKNLKKKPVLEIKCYTSMLGILPLKTNFILVQFNLILSWQNPQKLGQGICGFHWGVAFSYLKYASLDVPLLWEI